MSWFYVDESGVIPKDWFDNIKRPLGCDTVFDYGCVYVVLSETRRRIMEGID